MNLYRIASFNLYKFSTNKELETIANIIRDNNVDILAIHGILGGKIL